MFSDIIKSIARNSGIMVFKHVITMTSSIVIAMMLPRYLGPMNYGRLFFVTSLTGIFGVFIIYGGNLLISKDVARNKEETAQILVNALAFRLLLALISMVTVLGIVYFGDYNSTIKNIALIFSIGFIFGVGVQVFEAGYQGHELLKYTAYAAIAERVIIAFAIVIAVWFRLPVVAIAIFIMIGVIVHLGVLIGFSKNIFHLLPKVKWDNLVLQIREGLPYFLYAAFGAIYYKIDAVMLSKMVPENVVGWYGASYRLFEALNFPYILSITVYPILSRLWMTEEILHRRTVQKSLEYVIIAGVPVSVGIIVLAKPVISLFYGMEKFTPSVLLLQILAAGLIFLYINMVIGTTLLAADQQRKMSFLSLSAIPLNVVMNFIMIPYFQTTMHNGAIGAAVATGGVEIFIMVVMIRLLPNGIFSGFRTVVLYKTLSAGSIMLMSFLILDIWKAPFVVQIIVAALIYIGSIFAMRTFESEEEKLFLQYLRRIIPIWN